MIEFNDREFLSIHQLNCFFELAVLLCFVLSYSRHTFLHRNFESQYPFFNSLNFLIFNTYFNFLKFINKKVHKLM